MKKTRLEFDEESHRYRFGARVVPSVTQVLERAGLVDAQFVTRDALARGSAVHAEIARLIVDGTGEPSAYAVQAMRFCEDLDVRIIATEEMVFHPLAWYAGRIDLVCKINGRVWLIDWKLNTIYKTVGPQLAAYKEAWNLGRKKNRIEKVGAVRLTERAYQFVDSQSSLWQTDVRADLDVFLKATRAGVNKNGK